MRTSICLIAMLLCCVTLRAQVTTANDAIPSYSGDFLYGANMGYYPLWDDEELADIAAGNDALGIDGVGVKSLRPLLPEWFLELYGYDYRVPTFMPIR